MLNIKFLFSNFWHFLALGFGAGLSKKAPGTIGSLIAFPLFFIILPLSSELQISFVITLFFLGIHASNITSAGLKLKDPACIVIDEIVAMLLILIIINYFILFNNAPISFVPEQIIFFLSFLIFRFFDVMKPFPIKWFEKKFKGGFGIMIDDIVAAIPCIIIMYFFI